jgi:mono/diheme cytochrome c family protein
MERNGRHLLLLLFAFTCIFILAACDDDDDDDGVPANPQFSGTFRGVGTVTQGGETEETGPFTLTLTVGSPLSGTIRGDGAEESTPISGDAEGDNATFTFASSGECPSEGNGTATLIDDNTLEINVEGSDCDGPFSFTAMPTRVVDASQSADLVRGGLLYDRWWRVNEADEPAETNPTYPVEVNAEVNPPGRMGSQTWRCKECHGWDYQGKDGAYGSGSHFTGIAGILNAQVMAPEDLFDIIRTGTTGLTGTMTGYTSDQLSDNDVQDLVSFIEEGLIDVSPFIDAANQAIDPDLADGEQRYNDTCAACHGVNGDAIDFGGGEGIREIAEDNPQEFFHKVRFGQPGTTMPSAVNNGWTNEEVRNVLGYAQTLPPFGEGEEPPSGDATAGQVIYDAQCAVCHSLGTHDTTTAAGGNELAGKGDRVVNDLSTVDPIMNITLTDQEVADVAAWLDAN